MRTVVVGEPPADLAAWLERRRALGQDLFDEVWEGDYHVPPAPHSRHGWIDGQVSERLGPHARDAGLKPFGPLNIGEPEDYRVPDRTFLRERTLSTFIPTAAIVVEIVSRGDETFDKFGFYFARGVEELLVLDSTPGAVEWYARGDSGFERTGHSALLDISEEDLAAEIGWPAVSAVRTCAWVRRGTCIMMLGCLHAYDADAGR